jgi:uncharacterized membrane protein YkvA (DUF1232 family)
MLEKAKHWARALKRDVVALWIAARDPRTPWYAKLAAGAVAAYALSPIDLIPDFVPVLGYLDDLVIVPLGIALAIRLVPPALMAEYRATASLVTNRPQSLAAAATIAAIWVLALGALGYWIYWQAG